MSDIAAGQLKFEIPNTAIEILPAGYIKNESGIFRVIKKGGVEERVPICYTPIRISKVLENPDTKEVFYNVSFPTKNGMEKDITVSGEDLFQKKGIMALNRHGLGADEGMVKGLTNYLAQIVAINNIPTSQIYDNFGWKEDGGFVLGATKFTSEKRIPITLSYTYDEIEAIEEMGTVESWLSAIEGMMKYDNQRFKMYVAVTATILRIVGERNFSIHDYGESSIGKTLSTNVVMSMYGNTEKLELSGSTTKVGAEIIAAIFCDLPIHLDDTQKIDKDQLESIIYMIANGVGKLRGAKLGGLQEVLRWHNVGMMTGEAPIASDNSFAGMDSRVLEIKGGVGKYDPEAVKTFKENIDKHHGVFAPILIEYLIKNKDAVKTLHEKSKQRINEVKGKYALNMAISGIADRIAGMFASILTAGYIFENLYGSIGGEVKTTEQIEQIVTTRFEKAINSREFGSYAEKGLAHILSWISANESSFLKNGRREYDRDGNPKNYKVLGNITEKYYDILPSELKTELERAKYNLRRLMEDFKEAGYLECDKNHLQRSARIELGGENIRVYRFKRKNIKVQEADAEKDHTECD